MSLDEVAICVVGEDGKVLADREVPSTPDAIAAFTEGRAPGAVRIVLETKSLSVWLHGELRARGLPVIRIDARHAKAALSMRINKLDGRDWRTRWDTTEAPGLRRQDVDFECGRVTIVQVVAEAAGTFWIREGARTADSPRTIALASSLMIPPQRQRARVAELRLRLGRHWQDMALVSLDPGSGGPSCPASATRAFRRAANQAEWPKGAAVHGLRHASASVALSAGVDHATISRRLGHASVATAAKLCLHSRQELDATAAAAIAARIGLSKSGRS